MKAIITILILIFSVTLYSQGVESDMYNEWDCIIVIHDLVDISENFSHHPVLKLRGDRDIKFICEYVKRIKPIVVSEEECKLILRYGVSGEIKIQELTEIINFSKRCANEERSDFGELKIIITYSSESDGWLTLPPPPPKTKID